MRIVSFVPHATELLDALGLGEQVVSFDTLDDPADALEAIDPDLIVTRAQATAGAPTFEELEVIARSLPTQPRVIALVDPTTFGETLADARTIAQLTGTADAAVELVKSLRSRVDAVRRTLRDADRAPIPVAAIERFDPVCVAGRWTPQLVEYAGGFDVLGLPGEPAEEITWDVLKAAGPEVIVAMPRTLDAPTAYREAEMHADELRSIGARRVVAVDGEAYFSRPGPHLVEALELLAHVLHPDLFADAPSEALAVPLD